MTLRGRSALLDRAWSLVSPDDLAFGQTAYLGYHEALRAWARHYGFGFIPTVEAFVALSPNNDYHGNLRSLSSVMATVKDGLPRSVTTYRACATRAAGYLAGEVSFLDRVTGPKITAFRDNILYLGESRRVTVDGHMICIWADKDLTMKEAAALLAKTRYAILERDFLNLSGRVSLPPCQVQAALWHSRKRRAGVRFDPQMDLFTGGTRWDIPAKPEEYPPFPVQLSPQGEAVIVDHIRSSTRSTISATEDLFDVH